jgi:hypothetical protein
VNGHVEDLVLQGKGEVPQVVVGWEGGWRRMDKQEAWPLP